ncbi:MAG TPA: hypothetical protein VFH73_21075, partial [Polyangia bacterium]|nr:hypothetical protein [Polyangia bacterium]
MKYHEGGRPAPDRPRLIVGRTTQSALHQTCTKRGRLERVGRNRTADGQRQIHDSGSFVARAATGRNTFLSTVVIGAASAACGDTGKGGMTPRGGANGGGGGASM